MKLVLEITNHTGDGGIQYRTVETFPAAIGRGYHNDIIISDPNVSAVHVRLSYDDGQWRAEDLGSENGVTLNNRPVGKASAVTLKSGDTLRLGRTDIRVFSPDHPVASTVLIQKTSLIFGILSRPLYSWALFAAGIATATGMTYLEVWSEKSSMTMAVAAAGAAFMVILWSAIWSVAGRLIRHKSNFTSHVALFSTYLMASSVLWFIASYINFLTNEGMIGEIIDGIATAILLSLLVYGGLSLSGDMKKKRRIFASALFSIGLLGGIYLFGYIGAKNFNAAPQYPYTLEPYMVDLAPAVTREEFMKESDALFSDDAFSDEARAADKDADAAESEAVSTAVPDTQMPETPVPPALEEPAPPAPPPAHTLNP